MKKLFLISFIAIATNVFAQQNMGIGTANPDASSLLELSSTTMGLLIPRMTDVQKNAIPTPATGLLVYQTNSQAGFWYFDGTAWIFLTGSSGGGVTGPTGANGTNGLAGATGPTGPTGTSGTNGATGPTGADAQTLTYTGNTLTISNGNSVTITSGGGGATGPTGPTGIAGINGATGPTGTAGTNGATGTTGTAGINGATGATGAAGTNGVTGATGPTGPTGDPATDDQILTWDGVTFTLTIDNGNSVVLPISGGSVGPTGPTGIAGTNGATGATGTAGTTGAAGPTGTAGTTGATGPTGADAQTLTYTGNTLTISNGNSVTITSGGGGATGATGPTGTAGTNGATGVTGVTGVTGPTGPSGTLTSASIDGNNNNVGGSGCGNATPFIAVTLPLTIADAATQSTTFNVTGLTGTVCDVTLSINITHTFDGDLDITLANPAATSIDVTSDNGGTGDNYTGTLFTDAATTAITAGTAPFTGSFLPEQAMSTFAGSSPNGTWTLTITDDASTDVGTLTGATLTISTSTGTFVFVGETSITLAVGETSIVTSTYSVKNSSTTDVAVKLTRSTVSGAGTPGTDIGFAASTPPAANTYISTAVNERETGLGSGTYFYKLWKVATPVAGTENYAVIVVKH